VPLLLGDPSKAKKKLGWEPRINFEKLVEMMYESDFAKLKQSC
jgi:GDPmannose 4,6-dehydratase